MNPSDGGVWPAAGAFFSLQVLLNEVFYRAAVGQGYQAMLLLAQWVLDFVAVCKKRGVIGSHILSVDGSGLSAKTGG